MNTTRTTSNSMNTGLDADLDSSRFVLRVCAPGSSGCFPSADASDRYCRRFAKVICRALPPAMQDRIVYGDGASLRITQFIDGTVTAETSDINTEPSAADQRPKPGAGEIAVILAKSPAPWGASSEDDSSAVSWQGILALKGLTA